MKRIVSVVLLLVSLSWSLVAGTREAEWQAVAAALKKGLPRTALTHLEKIIPAALADRAYGEAAKAVARKIALEGEIQGNKPEEKITRLEQAIAQAPPEIRPLLNTIQALCYWQYFQQNKWRFLRRTATAEPPGKDFTTWALPRLFAEIDRRFTLALTNAVQLQRLPVSAFDDLLEKGTLPDRYRPTLYDFIAHEALQFYTSGEQAAARPENAYDLPADSPALADAPEFLAWWKTFDTARFPDSPILKALDLYARLLRFHEHDRDPSAFLDADLARLVYAHNTAFGEEKDARYTAALKRFAERWADHELSAMAWYHLARQARSEDDFLRAHEWAERGLAAHPDSPGGKLCRNLIGELEARSLRLATEKVWNRGEDFGAGHEGPEITVRYRNLTEVHFRVVPWDWHDFLRRKHRRPSSLNERERKELLARKPVLTWSAKLPPTEDYREHTERLPAPKSLPAGHYFLLASHDPGFPAEDNLLAYAPFWVSDLALIIRSRQGRIEGFVLNANSGEPLADAEIHAWYLDRQGRRVAEPVHRTDADGCFSFRPGQRRGYLILARWEGREVAASTEVWLRDDRPARAREQTLFFTDRALYRPGQTIQFKGICLRVDSERNDYQLLDGRRVTVVLADRNNQEVARLERRCNDYGSFSGSFTAPRDRLAGRYRLRVIEGPGGNAWFNVEEYKRPKFRVTLDAPAVAPRLGREVVLTGRAEAYTGAAVDDALVKWRVVREVRWPPWWGWWGWRMPRPRGGQEIAHGVARTGADGTFTIRFPARPDPKVGEDSEAAFTFTVHADVTDNAGETRSATRGVEVGFVALRATVTADEWQTAARPVRIELRTTTLDGEPQAARGALKIYRLQAPDRVHRARWRMWPVPRFKGANPGEAPAPDLSDPNQWKRGALVEERAWSTDAEGKAGLEVTLPAGLYRALLETRDRFGKKVTGRLPLRVLDPASPRLALKIPHLLAAPKWKLEPGEEFRALWGTGYQLGRAFIEIEHRHRIIKRFWTTPGRTQQEITFPVTEKLRGGFTLHVTQVRDNRAYLDTRQIEVPWDNKELELTWEHFTSKLEPARKETWTLNIRKPAKDGASSLPALAELVATLYDASLDQFLPHRWPRRFNIFYRDASTVYPRFANGPLPLRVISGFPPPPSVSVALTYRHFPADLVDNFNRRGWEPRPMVMFKGAPAARRGMPTPMADTAAPMVAAGMALGEKAATDQPAANGRGGAAPEEPADEGPDLSRVSARKNLNETAFFYPQLLSDSNGVVRLTFTLPEALTTWRFMGFAHDRALRSGFIEGETVTAKDLMVQPNPPRFLREGDVLEFTVKVSNQSPARQKGRVRLTFTAAESGRSFDQALGNVRREQAFDIPAGESRAFSWRIQVPDGCPFLIYKAVGSTGRLSDGEEGYLPVLSRRIWVTESLPLPIRVKPGQGPVTRKFEFTQLLNSGRSDSLIHQGLVVQMVSNPAWYAVLALPYLMEFPHECAEQTFNRLYANALARHIAQSDPKIRRMFDQWKNTPALDSPLEKNQDLKRILLEETPWLRDAQKENEARHNVGVLFDDNRLDYELQKARRKLEETQLPDGAWPWFPGGRRNDYITLYITTGFGRLRHLGVKDLDVRPALRALERLDRWMDERYQRLRKNDQHPGKYVLSPTDALYLYGRSFFLKDRPVARNYQAAVRFYLRQARRFWVKVASRQSQGHLALALKRFNATPDFRRPDDPTPRDIMRSLKERSVTDAELGRFWRDQERSWWWYRAPIETQALMIEAFDEVMGDPETVEECRTWLLKQKQTQNWKTTKATADAVYALLLRGTDLLRSRQLVEVMLDGLNVTPGAPQSAVRDLSAPTATSPEPGTGFYEARFTPAEIKPELGHITVRKFDEGVAWGAVYWQYLEDMSKVTPYTGTPLTLQKSLYVKVNTPRGKELQPVTGPIHVGDELVVRLVLRVDRDMEYVHLKDQRGSGTEPVNVLSGYRFQDGLAYYETTRDTATHFFIDYLPKGTYVFEYSTRVQHRGEYQTGIAAIQCLYAPEFNSHSESLKLVVQ